MTFADQFSKVVKNKYPAPEKYKQSIKKTSLVRYRVNFKDRSSCEIIATPRQRDGLVLRSKHSAIIENTTGLGYVVLILDR